MLIGIISDSHDHLPRLEAGLERLRKEGAELLIHPGDIIAPFAAKILASWQGPLHVVYGNNDGERRGLKSVLPQIVDGPLLIECKGKRISLDHYPPDDEHPPVDDVDVILFGHTHEVVNEHRNGTLYLNPGENCGWVRGESTVATLDTDSLKADIIRLEA
ncbi:metallophosphoesterase [Symmachiella dynata]|uniref:metallophosphoesterase n=1 Tax=Symmachiella dynata TaxID=2527995 RepID=UPI0030EEF15E